MPSAVRPRRLVAPPPPRFPASARAAPALLLAVCFLQCGPLSAAPRRGDPAPDTFQQARLVSSKARRPAARTSRRKQSPQGSRKPRTLTAADVDDQLTKMLDRAAAKGAREFEGLKRGSPFAAYPDDQLARDAAEVYETLKRPFPSSDRSGRRDAELMIGPKFLEDLRASLLEPTSSREELKSIQAGTPAVARPEEEVLGAAVGLPPAPDGGAPSDAAGRAAAAAESPRPPARGTPRESDLLSVDHFDATMRANLLASRPDAVREVFALAKEAGLSPRHSTYSLLLQAHAQAGDIENGQQVFEEMKTAGLVPNVGDYTALMTTYVKNLKIEKAYEIYGQMRSAAIKPNHDVFATLIRACNAMRVSKRAWATYDRMRYEGWGANSELYTLMMECCAQNKEVERALNLFDEMNARNEQPTAATFNALIKACSSRADYSAEGFDLCAQMRSVGFYPDADTTASLIRISTNLDDLQRGRGLFFEGHINRGYEDSRLRVNADAATALLAAYGDVELQRDGHSAKEFARRRELAAALADRQRLEMERVALCLQSAGKRPSFRRRREAALRRQEENVEETIRRLQELGDQHSRERGDIGRTAVIDAECAPASAGAAAAPAAAAAAKSGSSADLPGDVRGAGPGERQEGPEDGQPEAGRVLVEAERGLPDAVRQFLFMRDDAPASDQECIAEATKVLTFVTGVHPAPANAQLAALAPPAALSAAADAAAVFRVEPDVAMLNAYLSTLLRRSPPRADAPLPAAALEVFWGLGARYGVEPNGHTYALVINRLAADVRGDPELCRDFPGRGETLHIEEARLAEVLRLFEEWKAWHAANASALERPAPSSPLPATAADDTAACVPVPADDTEVTFLKQEKGVTDLVFYNVYRDVCNALARCDRMKDSIELATELRDRHKYALNIRDFRDLYRASKRNDDGPSMLRVLDLCPASAHSALERAKTLLGTRLHGSPNGLQYYIGRKKRDAIRKRIVEHEEHEAWTRRASAEFAARAAEAGAESPADDDVEAFFERAEEEAEAYDDDDGGA